MTAARNVAIFAAFLVGTFGTVTGIALDIEMGNANQQIRQLQSQLGQTERADQRTQVRLEGEIAAIRGAFTVAEARIGGTHRDLITCADWQSMFVPVSGVDSFGGQLAASAGPPPLPQHCINQ